MKSALFVDFDNVYSGLRKLDPSYADRFARQPLRWVEWLLNDLAPPEHAPEGARRRLLVRRCYLNPQVYQRYRPAFSHAGFEIVDCPSMTSEGKTSTDIHMVLDMVDLLQHQVHYDEFIVFSADADFTPVLRKLRRWDRRTTVLAIGFPSAAYRASADLLIDPDLFLRDGLGLRENDEGGLSPGPDDTLSITPGLPSITPGSWSAAGLAAVSASAYTSGGLASGDSGTGHQPMAAPRLVNGGNSPLPDVDTLVARIRAEAARSELPVPCARLASRLMGEFPGLSPDWLGQGGFRRFLESLPLDPLALDWSGSGGYLFDPERHTVRHPVAARSLIDAAAWGVDAPTLALIRSVHDATGVPLLAPRDFRALFDAIVADVAEHPFQLNETGKSVRDRCRDAGRDISRESVNWVLRGLLLCGHEFGQGQDDVPTLSYRLVGNLINLCRREQVVMDEGAPGVLQRWMSGKMGE
ncbi:MAG: NYN domain-containing protein [Burkholderiales bacterium]|nr:NYN domain-containing protein [Burkholderiales bacterium]